MRTLQKCKVLFYQEYGIILDIGEEKMKRIVIIEDDEKLRRELKIFLQNNGYEVIEIEQFDHLLEQLRTIPANLILLDINLPNVDGIYLLKEIRKESEIPVIMITSRDSEMDELISMNYGADHYVTKPFHTQILLAKIVAILKRAGNQQEREKIDCGGFCINISKSRIEKQDETLELTVNELKILTILARKKGKIVSREEMINELWDSENFIDDNTLTVNMTRLKNKLETLGLKDKIETKRGQGYLLKEE